MDELLLGLDIGTSSSKAVLTGPDGAIVASAQREHALSFDVIGRPRDVTELTIGASHGDARLAGVAAGIAPVDASWNPIAETVQPRAELRPLYDRLYAVYRDLYDATRDLAHGLAEIQLAVETTAPEPAGAEVTITGARGR